MQLNNQGLYDIYGMYYTPFWQTNIFFWGIMSFTVLSGLLGAFFCYRWFKKRRMVTTWSTALQRLEDVINRLNHDVPSPALIKDGYFIVTAALKWYMAKRYGWAVEHLTDDEFVQFIESSDCDRATKDSVKNIYGQGMMIKFADKKSAVSNLAHDIARTRAIICATIPSKKRLAQRQ